MNVFLIGTGGREHAIAWKIIQSPLLKRLYCLKGNIKIEQMAKTVDCDPKNIDAFIDFCLKEPIDLVIIGPESYLVTGLTDHLRAAGIPVVGPSMAAAQLEGSKSFAKEFCQNFSIPTANYKIFEQKEAALSYIESYAQTPNAVFPLVIKADGLAEGKGVTIAHNANAAMTAITACFEGVFGIAGHKIVIEEFLEGEEMSFFCLCDGQTAIPLGSAQDYKRLLENDLGPNTESMGSYSPAFGLDPALYEEIIETIIIPTIEGLKEINRPFQGVLYAGLMITATGPKLLEYNVRFGDPEAQVLLPLFAKDFLLFLKASATGQLDQITQHTIYARLPDPYLFQKNQYAITITMANAGYPACCETESVIEGLDKAQEENHVMIFHAHTCLQDGHYKAQSGRVLNVTAWADSLKKAREKAYSVVEKIHWKEAIYRRDIGLRALLKQEAEPKSS